MTTTSGADLEIYDPEMGTWLPLMLANQFTEDGKTLLPKNYLEGLFSAESDSSIAKRLHPQVQEDWSLGMGVSYDWAPGLYTRTPGYVCPAGAPTVTPVPIPEAGQVIAFEEYGGELFCIQTGETTGAPMGGRVLRFDNTAQAWVASLVLTNLEYMRGILAAGDGSGNTRLYAFSSDGGVNNGRVHEYDGTSWTSTVAGEFGSWGRADAKTVFWTTADGIGAHRIVCISGERTVSYTLPNADPLDGASWVEGVRIGGAKGQLRKIAAARTHVYLTAEDGLFDLDELGNSPNLLSYVGDTVQQGNGMAVQYHDGAVFMSLATGIDRVIVEQNGMLQEMPGMCGPNWGTRGENPVVGVCTAMTTDQGYLVAAIYNQATNQAFVCYGKSARSMGVENSRNPMLWWGPEVHFAASGTAPQEDRSEGILALRVTNLTYGQRRLWMASLQAGAGRSAHLSYVSVPLAGAPLQDVYSQAGHDFATGTGSGPQPFCRLYSLPKTYDDKPSLKIMHQLAIGSRGLNGTTSKIVGYYRADPAPGSTEWGTGVEITASPSQTVTPATVKGYELWQRLDFFSASGAVPFLSSQRETAWKVAPSFSVWTLAVQYGAGVVNLANARGNEGALDPDYVTERLGEVIKYGPTTLRDRLGRKWTAKLEQVMNREVVYHDESPGKTVTASLEVTIIGAA